MELNTITWIIYITISCNIGIVVGILIAMPRNPKCTHNWVLIEDDELFQYSSNLQRKIKVGFIKVYECTYCNKMKKEQVTL